jgi:hypothetical protein
MNYIFESMFVGIYSCIIYVLIRNLVNNAFVLFFVTGFIKHLLGYLLNIHSLYCKYGYACQQFTKTTAIYSNYLVLESIGEGILYLLFGIILGKLIVNKVVVVFIIGVLLHLMFEILEIHRLFCKKRCLNRPY